MSAEKKAREKFIAVINNVELTVASVKQPQVDKSSSSAQAKSLFDDLMEEEPAELSSRGFVETAEAEFSKYLADRDLSDNPLEFFKKKAKEYPRLLVLVPQVLCAPASTACVERLFSVAGCLLTARSMSLTDDNFENQLFLSVNDGVLDVQQTKRLKLE